MALTIDPKGLETRAMYDLIDFCGKDVLEIGCGDGRVTWRYAADAATVTAIDPDVAMVEAAQDALPEELRRRFSSVSPISPMSGPSIFQTAATMSPCSRARCDESPVRASVTL